ncbi:MAG: hypothetical protein LBC83_05760 [Oscillospiraceae bacterium]|jgi:ABC-type microcin C transport system permease subunit YejE|nr:hypothetical protein [Oscillospiraceae bacterium]
MFDILSIFSTLFGTAAGTHELLGGFWGWLQLLVDSFVSVVETIQGLLPA